MACVRKRRGKWVLDYADHQGKRRWETTKGTRKEAEQLLAKRLREIGRGEYQARADYKVFDELVESYRVAHLAVNLRENTRRDYECNLRLYIVPYFAGIKIRNITPDMVETFRSVLVDRGVGRRTVNKCHTLLSTMLRYALRHRWLNYNPAAEIRKLRDGPNHRDRPLDENVLMPGEVWQLIKAADERWRAIFLTAVSTGLRQGELFGLRWSDIDWTAKQIHVRRQYTYRRFCELKTRYSRRRVGLSDELIAELKRWKLRCPKGEHDLVFPTGAGNPENHSNLLRRGFYPALRRAGLRKIRFHDLRHTYASLLIAANVHPKRIQALLGHSSIKVTMDTYGHLMNETDNEAAEHIADLLFGSKMVATDSKEQGLADVSHCFKGGQGRNRTTDTRIFSIRGTDSRWFPICLSTSAKEEFSEQHTVRRSQ